jgi:ubiquinone/menaquinone biosynthesis C-methylase UbiE/uncharacterized protein YbaR (Trm112 family)
MKLSLLKLLACPKCRTELAATESERRGEHIWSGSLACCKCGGQYPIVNSIPRFVPAENYAASFGFQWNYFKYEQLDSANRTRLSEDRFWSETGWTPNCMDGQWIMEAGCGAGRFLEIASRTSAQVVGVDISHSVDACREVLASRDNVHLVQASIFELPFRDGAFDACYSIGVLQHTPDPPRALASLPRIVRPDGEIAVTIYERRRWTILYSKYLFRRITTRLNQRTLFRLIKWCMPVLFPLTEVLFRLPVLGRYFQFAIPVANYVEKRELTLRQRYRWALLDTFDMLAPTYDLPMNESEAQLALASAGVVDIRRLPNRGLNLVARKPSLKAVEVG